MTETVDTGTGEIAVRTPDEIVTRGGLPADQVALVDNFMATAVPEASDDPEVVATRIMAQILSANTPDEVLADLDAEGLREHLDTPFLLDSVDFRNSEYEEGAPFYVLLHGRDVATGEKVLLTTGAKTIIAQAFRLAQLGELPQPVVARQAKRATKKGYFPLRLVKAD